MAAKASLEADPACHVDPVQIHIDQSVQTIFKGDDVFQWQGDVVGQAYGGHIYQGS